MEATVLLTNLNRTISGKVRLRSIRSMSSEGRRQKPIVFVGEVRQLPIWVCLDPKFV